MPCQTLHTSARFCRRGIERDSWLDDLLSEVHEVTGCYKHGGRLHDVYAHVHRTRLVNTSCDGEIAGLEVANFRMSTGAILIVQGFINVRCMYMVHTAFSPSDEETRRKPLMLTTIPTLGGCMVKPAMPGYGRPTNQLKCNGSVRGASWIKGARRIGSGQGRMGSHESDQ